MAENESHPKARIALPMTMLASFVKERSLPFIRENRKIIAQFILTLLFLGLGIWFVKHERGEIHQVREVLSGSNTLWVLAGIIMTFVYIVLQGLMYVASFQSVRTRLGLWDAIILFLKRNLISVFLPAGGISSLAFFTKDIEKKGITKSQINFASSVYGFVGILSVIIVALPAFIYALFKGSVGRTDLIALFSVIAIISSLYLLYLSVIRGGTAYRMIKKVIPSSQVFMEDLATNTIGRKHFLLTVIYSIVIEVTGIFHLYIAMKAMGYEPSLFTAVIGYIVAVVFLIISPFLRGLGAIELSMTWVLIRFGYSNVEALAITLLYRFFEFWLPLFAGIVSFMLKVNRLLMRVLPAFLLFILGIINIVSVLTPAISSRLTLLKDFLPVNAIDVSNYFVFVAGLFMLVTAAFMLKGLKSVWWFALFLSLGSLIGHLTKAIDYEEATVSLVVIAILIATRKEYYIKGNPKLRYVGIQTAVLSILAVLLYGIIGFYFLNKRHFNIDFSLWQSIRYTISNYFLVGSSNLHPAGRFARDFLVSINICGFLTLSFLVYTLIRPYVSKVRPTLEESEKAKILLEKYGRSALDFFKIYPDKMFFFNATDTAFLAYRISGSFAIVLEDPVAETDSLRISCIEDFDRFCYNNGLKSIYYRIPESSINIYKQLGKKVMLLGQEGVVDLSMFSLEGGQRRSLRNAVNKVRSGGYHASVHEPPLKDGLLQKLKSVSNEWLEETGRSEIIFSQGMFKWEELKQQTILTVENPEEMIVAFVNIIPDFAGDEGTYDLIRKTNDAPNGIMDFLLIELFNYFRTQNIRYLNLGFAPMSGLTDPRNFPERSMKFAYEKIRSFSHYKGLRDFKEKYSPLWTNRYLVFEHDYDLLQVPRALNRVIRP
ncbi:MAG TPA: bifunctional lysylphosphatidylglycerol flippase/synthetase MprF [Bacteroidales bacterium]|nr:bifunctional lysylphosphatidylglycerol flippase/synthetase MprF [Bacteroidales bacterium]